MAESGLQTGKHMRPQYLDYTHDITCIDTEQVRRGMACCYLVRGGERYAFIDTGTSHSVPGLLGVLREKGIQPSQVDYVMPTHVHLDHAGGAGALLAVLPNAKVVVHPRGAKHLADPARLVEGATAVYGAVRVSELYGRILPVPQSRMLPAQDGYGINLGGRALSVLDAPGHAEHHFVIWDAASRGFFTGDTFGISYREFDGPNGPFVFPTTTPVQFNPDAWLKTLDRVLAHKPQAMYLTHFGRIADVNKRAADLRAGLGIYQELAQALADAPDRHVRLKEALMLYALVKLAVLDCPLSEAQTRSLLDMDMELNTQGLEHWLDKSRERSMTGRKTAAR